MIAWFVSRSVIVKQSHVLCNQVITIAHRLKTIIDYDSVMVMGGGKVLEYDKPATLLKKEDGAFRSLCMQSCDWDEISHTVEKYREA